MTEPRRMVQFKKRIEVLVNVRRNAKIPNIDLLETHHILAGWLKAYNLHNRIIKMSDIVFLGPFWDLLASCGIHLHQREKEELLCHFIRGRHHL